MLKVDLTIFDNLFVGALLIIFGVLYLLRTIKKRHTNLSIADQQDLVSSWMGVFTLIGLGLAIVLRNI